MSDDGLDSLTYESCQQSVSQTRLPSSPSSQPETCLHLYSHIRTSHGIHQAIPIDAAPSFEGQHYDVNVMRLADSIGELCYVYIHTVSEICPLMLHAPAVNTSQEH